jgi:hypothetical protein
MAAPLERSFVVAVMLLALAARPARPAPAADLAALLPPASTLRGWTVAEGPVGYGPDDLFEYMDGGAERYLSYGFRALAHVRYRWGADSLACVTLDVFDMGSDLGAFGIYRSGLTAGATRRDWGVEGRRSGTLAAAWKKCLFVHAEADDDRPVLVDLMERLVAHVCAGSAGGGSLPPIIDPLPKDGLLPQSERFVPIDLLGHAFLRGGVLATYEIDGTQGELFFCDAGTAASANEAIARLRAHHAKRGTIDRGVPALQPAGLRFLESGKGRGTAVAQGRFVVGVHGEMPYAAQERLLGELLRNLRKR